LTAADHVAELRKIDGWLQDPRFDVVAGGEHLKAVLFASVGRETVVRFCTQFGVVRGGPPATAAQLRSMVGEALKILAPQTSMAAAIGVPDDGVPF
jgi:hypothetical protein